MKTLRIRKTVDFIILVPNEEVDHEDVSEAVTEALNNMEREVEDELFTVTGGEFLQCSEIHVWKTKITEE